MQNNEEIYLGDGLYASYDGYQVQLRAPREAGDDYTCLDSDTYNSLLRFVKAAKCFE